jgi:flagellar protein FliS
MQSHVRDEYLETEVMTATPQKLHLMLLDAAVRHCERARRLWHLGLDRPALEEQVCEPLSKAQDILSELLASLNYTENPALVSRIAGIYQFIFRAIVAAQVRLDEASLADALRLLGIERETWRQLVARTSGHKEVAATTAHPRHSLPAPVSLHNVPTSSFSMDA